jgi:hypothetical protein
MLTVGLPAMAVDTSEGSDGALGSYADPPMLDYSTGQVYCSQAARGAVIVFPKGTGTFNACSSSTVHTTDICSPSAEAGGIPCAGTDSKIDIDWLPAATASATNALYSAGGLIWKSTVNDTATGTGTGSATVTQTTTRAISVRTPVAYTWIATGTRTATLSFTSTGTTTATLTVTGFDVDSVTRTGTGTGTQTRTVTASYTGTATATGTNTGTGTTSGTAVATATGSGTITASSTALSSPYQWGFVSATVADTQTHTATGWQTITYVVSATETGTTTETAPAFGDLAATLTATATVTGATSGTWTNTTTHTATGTSALVSDNPLVSDTKVNTHVLATPFGANKTLSTTGTTVLTSSDLATETPQAGVIPLAKTDSKIDIGWLPTGTASNSVVTGADPRLTDSRASTNTLYGEGIGFRTATGTGSATTSSASVASNPTVVNTATAVVTQTLSAPGGTSTWANTLTLTQTQIATATPTAGKIPIADGSGTLNGWITGRVQAIYMAVSTSTATASPYAVDVTSFTYSGQTGSLVVWGNVRATGTNAGGTCFAQILVDSTLRSIDNYGTTTSDAGALATFSPMAFVSALSSGSHTVTLQVLASEGQTCTVGPGLGSLMGFVSYQ